MATATLSREAARRRLNALEAELGKADRVRMRTVLELMQPDGRVPLGATLDRLYPDQDPDRQWTLFGQFQDRLATAVHDAKAPLLALTLDGETGALPTGRWCRFAGEDPAERRSAEEIPTTERLPQDVIEVDGKRTVRYFVCYARDDDKLPDKLLRLLKPFLDTSPSYSFKLWRDTNIDLGTKWHQEIQEAIETCDFGLLLVSPAFLASPYITRHELPHFVSSDPFKPTPGKLAAPVALVPIRFDDTMDLKGLKEQQVFLHDGKAFEERRDTASKRAFANELFGKIIGMLDSRLPPAPPPSPTRWTRDEAVLRSRADHVLDGVCLVSPSGHTGSLSKSEALPSSGERQDALKSLMDWVTDPSPEAPPCCALLGDYGMGKTTTSAELTRRLLADRRTNPALPLPIYLDLRLLGEQAKALPKLTAILDTVLEKSWHGGRTETLHPADEVVRQVQEDGALVIFDGLDEVLVHLSDAAGRQFVKELYRILPPALWPGRRKAGTPGKPGRVMMTCRSHYFRTLRDQSTFLTAEGREDIGARDYRVFILLPFTTEQIREYLTRSLPGMDIDRVLATLGAVHNLAELAERPYTLKLISEHFPQIERWKAEGRTVTGVDLYGEMVKSWVERDAGKHQFTPDHKLEVMELFAAALWRSGQRTWSIRDVEQWLMDFLRTRPEVAAHYEGRDRALLKEDLRTATFLVRDGGSEDQFGFAHSSLLEFFLAGFLTRALVANRPEDWALPAPSPETLDFLGQRLTGAGERDRTAALATLRRLRDGYRPQASERAFAYVLLAQAKRYPTPSAAGFRLEGADLRNLTITGTGEQSLLALRGARFTGARLGNTVFRHVDLDDAVFDGADLFRTELIGGRARGVRFAGAELAGTLFRGLELDRADFTGARPTGTRFLDCRLPATRGLDATPPAAFFALCQPAGTWPGAPSEGGRFAVLTGHQGPVWACAFSPDGSRIASAGRDGTLRLWRADNGEAITVLTGHQGAVIACAFSPDGSRIASAGGDGTLRLWRADSGEEIAVLTGHQGRVMSCAFSRDSGRIASAGDDGTLRLWRADSGEEIAVLTGHQGPVWACAFSPDDSRIASAGDDGTLRLWRTASGEAIAVVTGHQGAVWACAFSPDSNRIASAGDDGILKLLNFDNCYEDAVIIGYNTINECSFSPDSNRIVSADRDGTLRLWRADNGEAITVLTGHQGAVWSCAFSPDGRRIVSAGDDGTLRLWRADNGEAITALTEYPYDVTACAFSPDGSRIASAGDDGTLRLWDADGGEEITVLTGHEDGVWACAFSPDGNRIASAGDDETLRLWRADSGEKIAMLTGHQGAVKACAFSPDGNRIASAGRDGTLRLWQADSGKDIAVLTGHQDRVTSCAFSPNGSRIASTGSDGTLRLWQADSRNEVAILKGHQGAVMACAFSPDGSRIASAGRDGTLRLWRADGGEAVAVLTGYQDWINAYAFSPDGSRVASAGDDGTLRLWDVATGRETGFRIHHLPDGAWAVFDPDTGGLLRTGGEAWRWLGWLAVAPGTGELTRYPAESFGALPGPSATRGLAPGPHQRPVAL